MGSIMDKVRATRAKREAAAPVAPTTKPRMRVNASGDIQLPQDSAPLQIGGPCNHCPGTGRYLHFKTMQVQKCYRCNGKGVIDERDYAYYANRQQKNLPISGVFGG